MPFGILSSSHLIPVSSIIFGILRVVVDDSGSVGLVEARGQVGLSNSHADGIADASAQGTCVPSKKSRAGRAQCRPLLFDAHQW